MNSRCFVRWSLAACLAVCGATPLAMAQHAKKPAPASQPSIQPTSQPTSQPASPPGRDRWKRQMQQRMDALTREMKAMRAKYDKLRPGQWQKKLSHEIDVLAEEIGKLEHRHPIPEHEHGAHHLSQLYGRGPDTVLKLYGAKAGFSVGGYGEVLLGMHVHDRQRGEHNTADFLRYVQYFGYKFSEKLFINAELEIEHSSTEHGGELTVEFAYAEYLLHPMLNLRAGVLLMPVGWLNEVHEPTTYHGVLRPDVERVVLPSTWSELGVGLFGRLPGGLTYKLYFVTALDATRFSPEGWSEARQRVAAAKFDDFGGVLRLDYSWHGKAVFGASCYVGGADHNQFVGFNVTALLAEAHAQVRTHGLELRALGAFGTVFGARELSLALYPESGTERDLIARHIYGWYAEVAYDLWPLVGSSLRYLAVFARFEMYDTQADLPEVGGEREHHREMAKRVFDVGLTFKPHPQIVLKVDLREYWNAAGTPAVDTVYIGGGFMY
ncbi:MAG: PT domain-containing protein [Myxococcales bacterium]|nr:PT domain-containing protein [Myxococcales bacterium]